jgi:hypothetical protein
MYCTFLRKSGGMIDLPEAEAVEPPSALKIEATAVEFVARLALETYEGASGASSSAMGRRVKRINSLRQSKVGRRTGRENGRGGCWDRVLNAATGCFAGK